MVRVRYVICNFLTMIIAEFDKAYYQILQVLFTTTLALSLGQTLLYSLHIHCIQAAKF